MLFWTLPGQRYFTLTWKNLLFQNIHFATLPHYDNVLAIDSIESHPCGVIATVFQPLQPIHKKFENLTSSFGGEIVEVRKDSCNMQLVHVYFNQVSSKTHTHTHKHTYMGCPESFRTFKIDHHCVDLAGRDKCHSLVMSLTNCVAKTAYSKHSHDLPLTTDNIYKFIKHSEVKEGGRATGLQAARSAWKT